MKNISKYIHYLRISAAAEEFSFGLFMAAVFFVAYLIVGGFFVFLSGSKLLFINAILISLIIPFLNVYLVQSDPKYPGLAVISLLSLAFAIHTSGPIFTPSSFCSSTWSTTTKVTPSLGFEDGKYTYQEEKETRRVSDQSTCMRDSVDYMFNSEVHGTMFILSWVSFGIFGLIFFFTTTTDRLSSRSSGGSSSKKDNHPLDQEILSCEKIMEDAINNDKKLPETFYKKVMKVSDMLNFYESPSELGLPIQAKGGEVKEKISRHVKIENLLALASEKAPETFIGDKKQVQKLLKTTLQIKGVDYYTIPKTVKELQEQLSYSPGQGYYYEDEWVKWWGKK